MKHAHCITLDWSWWRFDYWHDKNSTAWAIHFGPLYIFGD